MPSVFIPNRSIHDFSEAEKFGELVFLSSGNMPRYKTSRIYRKFIDILDSASSDDYVLVSDMTILNFNCPLDVVISLISTLKQQQVYLPKLIKHYD